MTHTAPQAGKSAVAADSPRYRFGSKTVSSTLLLPALPIARTTPEPSDILIERTQGAALVDADWIHHWQERYGVVLSLARRGDDFWLRFPDVADFQLQLALGRIGVLANADADDTTLEHLLVDQVLPRFVAQLDTLVTHASAVGICDRHALFLGHSGWGKSTLAGLLHGSGHRVLSDDCVQLIAQDGQILALSTYPSLRLLPDSLDQLFPGMDNTVRVADYSEKQRVPFAPRESDELAAPLHALYLLGDPAEVHDAPQISPLSPADACRALIEHSFRLDLGDRQASAGHFARCSAAARAIPAFQLRYPRDYAQGPALVSHIMQHLAGLSPGRSGN